MLDWRCTVLASNDGVVRPGEILLKQQLNLWSGCNPCLERRTIVSLDTLAIHENHLKRYHKSLRQRLIHLSGQKRLRDVVQEEKRKKKKKKKSGKCPNMMASCGCYHDRNIIPGLSSIPRAPSYESCYIQEYNGMPKPILLLSSQTLSSTDLIIHVKSLQQPLREQRYRQLPAVEHAIHSNKWMRLTPHRRDPRARLARLDQPLSKLLALRPQHVQLAQHHLGRRQPRPVALPEQRARLGVCPVLLVGQVVAPVPEHLGRRQRGHELVLPPRGLALRAGRVVRDGHREQLRREGDAQLGPVGGALAHHCCEVAACRGAACGELGGVYGEEILAWTLDGPEEALPGVLDCGREGILRSESEERRLA